MQTVLLVSISPFSGKNVVGLGMARKLVGEGKQVGFFKPLGPLATRCEGVTTDEDALFFKNALHLGDPLAALCPIVLDEETISHTLCGRVDDVKERIKLAFRAVSGGKDVTLAMSMGGLSCGRSMGYSMADFAEDVDAKVLVIDRYRWPIETLDGLASMKDRLGDRLAGVVFNQAPVSRRSQIVEAVSPHLDRLGVAMLGMVPQDPFLSAVPIRLIVDALDGKVLCCGDRLDELAEDFCIGAMAADAALRVFRRKPNKLVITGGDRPDIHLAALETSTRCLLLTGDLYPNERILTRAEELGVPVVLVSTDTGAAAEMVDRLHSGISIQSDKKMARVAELIDTHLDWERMRTVLNIG